MTTLQITCKRDAEMLLRSRRGNPAAHLVNIIEGFGLKVCGLPVSSMGEGFLSLRTGVVGVNLSLSEEERAFILASLLGRFRLFRSHLEAGLTLSEAQEDEADEYAGQFLLAARV